MNRAGIIVGIAIVSVSLNAAQAPGPNQSAPEAEPASIEGFVVGEGTGEPLARARVLLRPAQGRQPVFGAVTDVAGRFLLENIDPGSYRLLVERDGFVSRQYGQLSSGRPGTVLVMEPRQVVRDVVIGLVPTGTISGRVWDEGGEPMVGARVRAFRYDYREGEKILAPVREAATNDLGEYRLYWLTPGEYFVGTTFESRFRAAAALRGAVLAAGGGPGLDPRGPIAEARSADPTDEIYVDTYYPGTNDPLTAAPLTVAPASEVRAVDFTVLPTRAVVLSGRVVGPLSGTPGRVTIAKRNGVVASDRSSFRGRGQGGRSGIDAEGGFELAGVAPGPYTLIAEIGSRQGRGGAGGVEMSGFLDVDVGSEDIAALVIPVRPSVGVTGQVLVVQGSADIDMSRLRVRLEPAGNLGLGAQNSRVEADGSFQIDNVSQTVYNVRLTGLPADAYVEAASMNGRDILKEGVPVTSDAAPIQFRVSGMGSRLDGTVRIDANQTFTGAQVVLIPVDPGRRDLYEVASADQYGRFTMRGIAPGSYRVFAWEDAPSGAYQDPEFVRRFEDFGERIDIDQGSQIQVQPRVIPAAF